MLTYFVTGNAPGGNARFELPKGKYSFQVICSDWSGMSIAATASLSGEAGEFGAVKRPPASTEDLVFSENEEPFDCGGGKWFEFSTDDFGGTDAKILIKRFD